MTTQKVFLPIFVAFVPKKTNLPFHLRELYILECFVFISGSTNISESPILSNNLSTYFSNALKMHKFLSHCIVQGLDLWRKSLEKKSWIKIAANDSSRETECLPIKLQTFRRKVKFSVFKVDLKIWKYYVNRVKTAELIEPNINC